MAVHFIRFRGDEYHSAVATWGKPDFFHRVWDKRAQQEVVPGDVAIFATKDETRPLDPWGFDDSSVF
jgi:hypothetical protein